MDRILLMGIGARRYTSTVFSKARNLPIFQYKRQPNTSWQLTSNRQIS
jgi:hypothetical protein